VFGDVPETLFWVLLSAGAHSAAPSRVQFKGMPNSVILPAVVFALSTAVERRGEERRPPPHSHTPLNTASRSTNKDKHTHTDTHTHTHSKGLCVSSEEHTYA